MIPFIIKCKLHQYMYRARKLFILDDNAIEDLFFLGINGLGTFSKLISYQVHSC